LLTQQIAIKETIEHLRVVTVKQRQLQGQGKGKEKDGMKVLDGVGFDRRRSTMKSITRSMTIDKSTLQNKLIGDETGGNDYYDGNENYYENYLLRKKLKNEKEQNHKNSNINLDSLPVIMTPHRKNTNGLLDSESSESDTGLNDNNDGDESDKKNTNLLIKNRKISPKNSNLADKDVITDLQAVTLTENGHNDSEDEYFTQLLQLNTQRSRHSQLSLLSPPRSTIAETNISSVSIFGSKYGQTEEEGSDDGQKALKNNQNNQNNQNFEKIKKNETKIQSPTMGPINGSPSSKPSNTIDNSAGGSRWGTFWNKLTGYTVSVSGNHTKILNENNQNNAQNSSGKNSPQITPKPPIHSKMAQSAHYPTYTPSLRAQPSSSGQINQNNAFNTDNTPHRQRRSLRSQQRQQKRLQKQFQYSISAASHCDENQMLILMREQEKLNEAESQLHLHRTRLPGYGDIDNGFGIVGIVGIDDVDDVDDMDRVYGDVYKKTKKVANNDRKLTNHRKSKIMDGQQRSGVIGRRLSRNNPHKNSQNSSHNSSRNISQNSLKTPQLSPNFTPTRQIGMSIAATTNRSVSNEGLNKSLRPSRGKINTIIDNGHNNDENDVFRLDGLDNARNDHQIRGENRKNDIDDNKYKTHSPLQKSDKNAPKNGEITLSIDQFAGLSSPISYGMESDSPSSPNSPQVLELQGFFGNDSLSQEDRTHAEIQRQFGSDWDDYGNDEDEDQEPYQWSSSASEDNDRGVSGGDNDNILIFGDNGDNGDGFEGEYNLFEGENGSGFYFWGENEGEYYYSDGDFENYENFDQTTDFDGDIDSSGDSDDDGDIYNANSRNAIHVGYQKGDGNGQNGDTIGKNNGRNSSQNKSNPNFGNNPLDSPPLPQIKRMVTTTVTTTTTMTTEKGDDDDGDDGDDDDPDLSPMEANVMDFLG
jgi:hypothetical protein